MLTQAFRILRLRGEAGLLCLVCDTLSFHPEDVQQKYCAHCNLFLDELAEDFRRPPPQIRQCPGWRITPAGWHEP